VLFLTIIGITTATPTPALLSATSTTPPPVITIYNLSYAQQLVPTDGFEHTHTLSALSGLANRDNPAFLLLWTPSDTEVRCVHASLSLSLSSHLLHLMHTSCMRYPADIHTPSLAPR